MDLRTKTDRLKEEIESASSENFLNFVIADDSQKIDSDLVDEILGGEIYTVLPRTSDMYDLLVQSGSFKSKSQAKNNWTKTDRNIEEGISSFIVGKQKLSITIFKPILCEN